MICEPYLKLGDIEIGNSLRTLTYVRRGLAGPNFDVSINSLLLSTGYADIYSDDYADNGPHDPRELCCYCPTMDFGMGYKDPAYDNAPWYDADRPESEDFLGIIPLINLLPPMKRNVTVRSRVGADVGPLVVGPRVVQVEGVMVAGSCAGMGYGERWLSRALSGASTVGCTGDAATVLPYCTADGGEPGEGSEALRELANIGITDGPVFSPAMAHEGRCHMQNISFQLMAGSGYLRRITDLHAESAIGTGVTSVQLEAGPVFDAGSILRFDASMLGLGNVVVTGQAGACPIVGDPDFTFTIDELPPDTSLIIDSSLETAALINPLGVVGSLNYVLFEGLWRWMRTPANSTYCIEVDATAATHTTGSSLTIQQVDMEL